MKWLKLSPSFFSSLSPHLTVWDKITNIGIPLTERLQSPPFLMQMLLGIIAIINVPPSRNLCLALISSSLTLGNLQWHPTSRLATVKPLLGKSNYGTSTFKIAGTIKTVDLSPKTTTPTLRNTSSSPRKESELELTSIIDLIHKISLNIDISWSYKEYIYFWASLSFLLAPLMKNI